MRVFIAAKMQGVAGIVDASQGSWPGVDYAMGRRLMTGEAAAAAQAALDLDAEVFVSDAHESNGYRNLLIEELPEDAWLICGDERPMGALEGLEEDMDALILIGFHSRHGHEGVLDATFNPRAVFDVTLNGQSVGEIGLMAAAAGHLGVPVVLVTGDGSATREAQELLPTADVLCVKRAVGRHAAWSIHPEKSRGQIAEAVRRSLSSLSEKTAWNVERPVQIQVTFKYRSMADRAATIPGVSRAAETRISFDAPDAFTAYGLLQVCIEYAATAVSAGKLI